MGTDKASLLVDGAPLISRVLGAVVHLGAVRVLGGSPDLIETLAVQYCAQSGLSHIPDEAEDPGPFGAIVAGLAHTSTNEVLVVSCDLAVLRRTEVDRLLSARRATDADVAVPMVEGRRQWHAIAVSRRIIPALNASYQGGVRSMYRGFSGFSECAVVSPNALFFADVDTPEDLARVTSNDH